MLRQAQHEGERGSVREYSLTLSVSKGEAGYCGSMLRQAQHEGERGGVRQYSLTLSVSKGEAGYCGPMLRQAQHEGALRGADLWTLDQFRCGRFLTVTLSQPSPLKGEGYCGLLASFLKEEGYSGATVRPLPSGERIEERGKGKSRSILKVPYNIHQYTINICENVTIPIAQKLKTFAFQKGGAPRVIARLFRMLPAIDFDDQPRLNANEIDDVMPNWNLTSKLPAFQALGAQLLPERLFSIGHSVSQMSCALDIAFHKAIVTLRLIGRKTSLLTFSQRWGRTAFGAR